MSKEAGFFRKNSGCIYSEKIRLNKRVILEVGPSETPFPIYGQKGKKMGEGEYYIGLDIDINKAGVSLNVLNHFGAIKNIAMITAKSAHFVSRERKIKKAGFPLREGSVDEVVMCNIVGDPMVMGEKLVDLFDEAVRVLQPKGEIVIVHTRPYIPLIEDLQEMMKKRGFELTNENLYDTNEINQYRPSEGNEGEYVAKFSRIGVKFISPRF